MSVFQLLVLPVPVTHPWARLGTKPLQMHEDSTRGRINLHLFGGWNCRVVIRILNLRYLTQLLFPVRVHPSLCLSQEVKFTFTLKKVSSLVQTLESWHMSQLPSASLHTRVRCQCLLCSHRGLFTALKHQLPAQNPAQFKGKARKTSGIISG